MTCRKSTALSLVLALAMYAPRAARATGSPFSCYPAQTLEVAGAESCPDSLDGSDLVSVIINHNMYTSGGNTPNVQLSCEYGGDVYCDYMVPDAYSGQPFLTDTTGGNVNPDYCPSELDQADQPKPKSTVSAGDGPGYGQGDTLGSPTLACPAVIDGQSGLLSSIVKGQAAQTECGSSICYNCLYDTSISCYYNSTGDLQTGSSSECPSELTCPAEYNDRETRKRALAGSAYAKRQVDTRKLRARLEARRISFEVRSE